MSIKPYDDRLTIIVRTKESSKCLDVVESGSNSTDYAYLSKQLYPNLQVDHFENCSNLKVEQLFIIICILISIYLVVFVGSAIYKNL